MYLDIVKALNDLGFFILSVVKRGSFYIPLVLLIILI